MRVKRRIANYPTLILNSDTVKQSLNIQVRRGLLSLEHETIATSSRDFLIGRFGLKIQEQFPQA